MTPATFGVDFKQLTELLVVIVALAFFVERAVSLIVEHRWYARFDGKGFKVFLALGASLMIVFQVDLDFLAILFREDHASPRGLILTAMVIAGGSKAAIKFMKDVLGVRSQLPKSGKK